MEIQKSTKIKLLIIQLHLFNITTTSQFLIFFVVISFVNRTMICTFAPQPRDKGQQNGNKPSQQIYMDKQLISSIKNRLFKELQSVVTILYIFGVGIGKSYSFFFPG